MSDQPAYTIAVRALCEFTAKRGDLDLRFTPSPSAQQGMAGYKRIRTARRASSASLLTWVKQQPVAPLRRCRRTVQGNNGARLVTLIVYTNTAGNQDGRDNDLFQIDAAGFLVDMGCVLVDHCSHAVNAASRVALQRAIRRIKPGDTLVVTRLGYLGSSISDAVSTLATLAAKGAHVFCLDAGKTDLCASGEGSPIRILQLAAELERDAKRARALDAAAIAKKDGMHQGRPASLSDLQQQQALKALAAGSTVTAIARVLSTSRQTIIRLRDAASRDSVAVRSPPVEH